MRTLWLTLLSALAVGAPAQDTKAPAKDPPAKDLPAQGAAEEQAVRVPSYPNVSCPIMGKPVSSRLHTDTIYGRLWICCKSCIEDIRADVEVAYRAAYPTTQKLANERSPVSGREIEEESPRIELQGFEFAVIDAAEAEAARRHAQVTLVKLHEPKTQDLENETCPVTGEPTVPNAFAVIEGTIVRLSSPKLVEEIQKDPREVLAKARRIRAAELEQEASGEAGK